MNGLYIADTGTERAPATARTERATCAVRGV